MWGDPPGDGGDPETGELTPKGADEQWSHPVSIATDDVLGVPKDVQLVSRALGLAPGQRILEEFTRRLVDWVMGLSYAKTCRLGRAWGMPCRRGFSSIRCSAIMPRSPTISAVQ